MLRLRPDLSVAESGGTCSIRREERRDAGQEEAHTEGEIRRSPKRAAKRTPKRVRPSTITKAAKESTIVKSAKEAAPTVRRSSAELHFTETTIIRGEAVEASKALPSGATHEIAGHDASGQPILKRKRFSIC